ncbi:hypothetical protein BD410DRAFT_898146 [Rickenella mellea]|uniref:Uncharacterized protein n=1 Tax=Rickenella mellea TaxID=50990 RepID=A0A4Y7Q6U2_9AGAM|nr:hypothetical protein BD410DRAFT_898146 [Rickenella mellea]
MLILSVFRWIEEVVDGFGGFCCRGPRSASDGDGGSKKSSPILDVLGDARGTVSDVNSSSKNACYPISLGRRVVVKVQGCMWGLWRCVRGDRIYVNRSLPFGVPSLIAPLFESFFRTREALALSIHNSRRRQRGRCRECRCAHAHHHHHQHQEQHHQEREGQGQEQAQETQVIPSPTQDTVNQAQDGYTPPASRPPASSAPGPPVPASAQPQPQVPTPPPPPPPELLWLTASKERKPLFVNPNPSSIGDGIAQEKEKSEHDERDRIREEGTVSPSGSSSNGCSVSDGSRIDASWVSLDE